MVEGRQGKLGPRPVDEVKIDVFHAVSVVECFLFIDRPGQGFDHIVSFLLRGIEAVVHIVREKEYFQYQEHDGQFDQYDPPQKPAQTVHPPESVPVKTVDIFYGVHVRRFLRMFV